MIALRPSALHYSRARIAAFLPFLSTLQWASLQQAVNHHLMQLLWNLGRRLAAAAGLTGNAFVQATSQRQLTGKLPR
jgi:hypothetical protein